jgi:uncharacterized membrane-anchored protein YhcB (DUF1043 family)
MSKELLIGIASSAGTFLVGILAWLGSRKKEDVTVEGMRIDNVKKLTEEYSNLYNEVKKQVSELRVELKEQKIYYEQKLEENHETYRRTIDQLTESYERQMKEKCERCEK